ncbi:MAG: M23 family metallopeptidase [Candidatus Hydrogenedentes bacterium]|nr:M23 family metallopeptidase [Candidatus Hydrogenedentota bacterium]
MKKWTVMLIPHDRGSTRTLTLSNTHLWVAIGMAAFLTFTAAFFFQRNALISREAKMLRVDNARLEQEKAQLATRPVVESPAAATPAEDMREIETRLRADYEASLKAIHEELDGLLEMERKARDITGLEPKARDTAELVAGAPMTAGGKGGGSGSLVPAFDSGNDILLPPNIIYGMSRPSADLIKQEIQVRTRSLGSLIQDMELRTDQIARVPASWPLFTRKHQITSRFGYRRDPFNRRIRHHDGTDISAPVGTKVRATARGVVKESTYDGDYGNIVKIDHGNGLETWYAHLSERSVSRGKKVERGDLIGKVGSTGRSTGPHLHYEVHKDGRTVNAAVYLD